MSGGRSLAAWLGVATLAAISTCAPLAPASGQPARLQHGPAVTIGEVGTQVGGNRTGRALHRALVEELSALGGVRLSGPVGARYVLRGSVTRLERRQVERDLEVRCEVSLVLSDARGNVRAMLSGRAGARGGGDAQHVERVAMQAAVRGALRPLPGSLH